MTQQTEAITPPRHAWTLYTVAFCAGLLNIPATIFAFSTDSDSLANLASIAEATSATSWGVIPLVVLLLFFGDRNIAGNSIYRCAIIFGLMATACALALFAVNPQAPYLSPAILAVVLLYSKSILAELMQPLVSATATSRTHRLHLFLTATAFVTIGGLISTVTITPFVHSKYGVGIPSFIVAGLLVAAAAAVWNKTNPESGQNVQTSDVTRFFLEVKAKRELLVPLGTIVLISLCVGFELDATTSDTHTLTTILLVIFVTANVVILLFLGQRAKKGLLSLGQLTSVLAKLLVIFALVYMFALATAPTSIWLTLQFMIEMISGVLMVTALVHIGDYAFDAESKNGKSDTAKYFLLAFLAALIGNKVDDLVESMFELSGMPIGLMNATLTVCSATLILLLTSGRIDVQGRHKSTTDNPQN